MSLVRFARSRPRGIHSTPGALFGTLELDVYSAGENVISVARAGILDRKRPAATGIRPYCAWVDGERCQSGPAIIAPLVRIGSEPFALDELGLVVAQACSRWVFRVTFGSLTCMLQPLAKSSVLVDDAGLCIARFPPMEAAVHLDPRLFDDDALTVILLCVMGSGLTLYAQKGGRLRWSLIGQ